MVESARYKVGAGETPARAICIRLALEPRTRRRSRVTSARRSFDSGRWRRGVRVGELEVRDDLLDVAPVLLGEQRAEGPQGVDREPGLLEVARRPARACRRRARRASSTYGRAGPDRPWLFRSSSTSSLRSRLSLRLAHRPAPARRRSPPSTRPPRGARSAARRRSARGSRATAPRRAPRRPAAPTRPAARSAPAPGSTRRARGRSARPRAPSGSRARGSPRAAGAATTGKRLALVERARDARRQRVDERGERARLGELGLRVADADLDGREREMRADAPPDLRVLGDRARLVEEADVRAPSRPSPRTSRGCRSAGTCA